MYSFPATNPLVTATQNSFQPKDYQAVDYGVDTIDRSHVPEPRSRLFLPSQPVHYDFDALVKQERADALSVLTRFGPSEGSVGPHHSALPYPGFVEATRQLPEYGALHQARLATSMRESAGAPSASPGSYFGSSSSRSSAERQSEHLADADQPTSQAPATPRQSSLQTQDGSWSSPDSRSETARLDAPILGIQPSNQGDDQMDEDDDPYDVSDEDDDDDVDDYDPGQWHPDNDAHLRDNDLGVLIALQARQDNRNLHLRSMTSFINSPNMLATYTPSPKSSPLEDPVAARIFCHFVNVTAPCISLFERHPANPSLIFQGWPIPTSQQHIWTCKCQACSDSTYH